MNKIILGIIVVLIIAAIVGVVIYATTSGTSGTTGTTTDAATTDAATTAATTTPATTTSTATPATTPATTTSTATPATTTPATTTPATTTPVTPAATPYSQDTSTSVERKTPSGMSYSFISTGRCMSSTGSSTFPPGSTVDQAIEICKQYDGTDGHKLGGIGKCLGIEPYGLKLADGKVYPFSGCLELSPTGGSGVYRLN